MSVVTIYYAFIYNIYDKKKGQPLTLDIRCCMLGKMFNKELTMARPLKFEYKGALDHVLARGNERREIFFIDTGYNKFKDYMAGAIEKYNCRVHCYVLMDNHYHLIIETPEATISRAMHYISSTN